MPRKARGWICSWSTKGAAATRAGGCMHASACVATAPTGVPACAGAGDAPRDAGPQSCRTKPRQVEARAMRHEWGGMHARRDEQRKAHARHPAAKQHAKAGAQAAKERTTRASKPRTLLAQSFRRDQLPVRILYPLNLGYTHVRRCGEGRECVPDEADKEDSGSLVCEP